MQLDLKFVRDQFGQLADTPEFVFAANAGGSYVANQVNDLIANYDRHTRVQPYERYETSTAAGAAMDRARSLWTQALNIDDEELTIGPSTSTNTYVLSQAISTTLGPGDEIVVTNQDHEANSGVWRRMARERGVTVKEWQVEVDSGLLDPDALLALLGEKTRWVCFTHCSNIVGTLNPVEQLVSMIKQHSPARVFIDAVALAPHKICNLRQLGVDGYVFSLYKVYGPHQSLMFVTRELHEALEPQCHYFNTGNASQLFNPAGPQHSLVAGCAGVIDYFQALHRHHFGDVQQPLPRKLNDLHSLISTHEDELATPILDYLSNNADVHLIGKSTVADHDRAPTISFVPMKQSARAVATKMQGLNIGTESGHFYAYRLLGDLGINPDDGVVRISLVHYNQPADVEKILKALDASL
ncbi:MAG: aminotransferase class V-fold PLP-dependent enzyme [Gammaproteobacteria bacterium]|nr:aminotransferase class V-fold PLP-dependent enzyme [Gammaproteobacteria bacterium]